MWKFDLRTQNGQNIDLASETANNRKWGENDTNAEYVK